MALLIIGVALNVSLACVIDRSPRPPIKPRPDGSYVPEAGEVLFFDGCVAAEIEPVLPAPKPGSSSACIELRLRLRNVSSVGLLFKVAGFDFVLGPTSARPTNVIMLPPRQDFILTLDTEPFDPSLVSVAGTLTLDQGGRVETKDLPLTR
jgi:hypothetical protein